MLAVSLPSGSFVTDQDRARPEFWLEHAQRYTGVAAMHAFLSCVERRTSPSIYGEVLARGTPLQWPLRALWRLGTAHWRRSSYTLILRAT